MVAAGGISPVRTDPDLVIFHIGCAQSEDFKLQNKNQKNLLGHKVKSPGKLELSVC